MVGEHSVGFKVTAAGGVRSQNSEHLVGVKTACAVACVNHNLKALKRMVVVVRVNFLFNFIAKSVCVVSHIIIIGF